MLALILLAALAALVAPVAKLLGDLLVQLGRLNDQLNAKAEEEHEGKEEKKWD